MHACTLLFSGRYNSLEGERVMAQETCDGADKTHRRLFDESRFNSNSNHGGDNNDDDDSEGGKKKILKIGYLSYDWRDHPMGR
jgi:hypothetical protein